MPSPAKDIADFLETQGVGTVGTNIYVGTVPDHADAPKECIGVFDTGSVYKSPKWQRDEDTVQVLVRSDKNDYAGGYALAESVFNALQGVQPQTINGTSYVLFIIIGGINHLQKDKQERDKFSLNFRVIRENISGGARSSF